MLDKMEVMGAMEIKVARMGVRQDASASPEHAVLAQDPLEERGALVPVDAMEVQVEMEGLHEALALQAGRGSAQGEAMEVLVVQQSRMDYLVV
jgi:hypothetical protein